MSPWRQANFAQPNLAMSQLDVRQTHLDLCICQERLFKFVRTGA